MTDPISENVAQVNSSAWHEGLAFAKFLAANAFIVVGGTFAAAFMILIFIIFVKALKGSNLSDLFKAETSNELSMTKFWTNVAYFSATLAFLAFNLLNQESGESVVMLWLVYLGVVGSSAIASKWLSLKYAPPGTTMVSNDPNSGLVYPPAMGGQPVPPGPAPGVFVPLPAAPPQPAAVVTPPSAPSAAPLLPEPTVPGIVVSTQIGAQVPAQPGVTVSTPG